MEYFLVPAGIILIVIAWAAIWLFSPRNDDEGELEELTGVINARKNIIEKIHYSPDYSERVMRGFNE